MEREEERKRLINEMEHSGNEKGISESTPKIGASRKDSQTSSGEPSNVDSCQNLRKSADTFLSTDNNDLSTLRELVSDNEYFDTPNTPKAFNSNTSSHAERSIHDIMFDLGRDSASSISTPVLKNFSFGNPTGRTAISDDTWGSEGTSSDASASTKCSEGYFARFSSSSSKNVFSHSQSSQSLTKLPYSYADISDISGGILPSNLNHYPKLFQLDSGIEADIGRELSFSFKQEDPTQPLPRNRGQELEPVGSTQKRPNTDNLVNNGKSCQKLNSTNSDYKPMKSLQQLTNPKNKNTDERLKKFRFKRPAAKPQT